MKPVNIIASVVLALGLIGLGMCVRSGIKAFAQRDQVVEVRGLAEREVPANKVTWPIVVKEVGNDLQGVYSKITTDNNSIVEYLVSNGVKKEDIYVSSPEVEDRQANSWSNDRVPFRYLIKTVVTVSSNDVENVRGLINRQGELLQKGIAVIAGDYNNQTIFEYTMLNDIKPEMIAEATKNAREAAKKFAEDSDSKIGKIRSARQGQFSIDDRDPYTPYIKKIRVVTSLTYALED